MNFKSIKNLSAFAFGIIAGFAIDKYATGENVAKLKEKLSDIYEKATKKPDIDYVEDSEVSVDLNLLSNADIKIYCVPEHAADLYDYMRRELKGKGYITIAEIFDTKWIDSETINYIRDHFTFDECMTYGWNYNDNYHLSRKSGETFVTASYPEDLMDIIYEQENDISVDTGSIMDTYMKWTDQKNLENSEPVIDLIS